MASEILSELIAGLRANGPDFAGDPDVAREQFEGLLATIPVDPAFTITNADLGGVPALKCEAPGVAADAALLYLHGGAYVVGSAQGYRGLAAELARAAGVTGWALEYRLAPANPFPAAVDDALAAYRALLESGIAPGRIVLAGDSAGGGLTLATLVRLRDEGLPLPAAALLISPWLDLCNSGPSIASKQAADPSLTAAGLEAMGALYLAGADPRTPLASPLFADLTDLPPVLVQVGTSEILLSDATRLAAAAGEADAPLELQVWPEMIHVWHAFHFMLPEGRAAIDRAGAFLSARLAGDAA